MNHRAKILIVDDDSAVLKTTRRTLESAGYETLGAQEGEEALRLALEHKPDLMLLDLNLPDIPGLEVCKQIKADLELQSVFVVILTATHTDSDSQSEGLEAGADGYIVQPIANRELVARVQALLRIRAAEQAARQREQQLHDLIANHVDGLLVLDESGHTLFANPATCEMLNRSEEELKEMEISLPLSAGAPIELDLLSPEVGQQVVEVRVAPVQWEGQPALLASLRDITGRKQAEEQILYQANLIATVTDAIIATDLQFNVQSWNKAAEAQYGWTAGQVIGHPLSEFIQSQYVTGSREASLQQVTDKGYWKGEVTQNRRDGSCFPVMASVSLVKDRAGRPAGYVAVNRDITERKRAEETLSNSEAEMRAIFGSMRDVVLVLDRSGRYLRVIQTDQDRLAQPPQELTGKTVHDIFPPEQAVEFVRIIQEVLESKQSAQIEYPLTIASRPLWFEATISAVTQDEVVWVARDITARKQDKTETQRLLDRAEQSRRALLSILEDRKRAEEALRESETRFSTIFHASPAAIAISRLGDSQFVDVNAAYEGITGYARAEIIGHTPRELSLWVNLEKREQLVQALREQGTARDIEVQVRRKSGEISDVLMSAELIELTGEHYLLTLAQDITGRKRMDVALRDKVSALQALAEIDREIIAATQSQSILDLVCRRAAELVRVDKSAIAAQTASGEMEMTASYGLGDAEQARDEFARVWQAGLASFGRLRPSATIQWNEVPAGSSHMPGFSAREGVRALVLAPLAIGEHVLGALAVFDTVPHTWSADELQVLSLLAGQAAIALDKVRLFEAEHAARQRLEMLYRIGQAITSTLDLDRIMDILLESVTRAADVAACSIALVDPDTGDLVFRRAGGQAGWVGVGMRLRPGEGIAGWVAQHRQSVRVDDAASDPRFYEQIDGATGFVTRNVVCVPLVAHDRAVGVIELVNKRRGAFSQDDVQLLESVAAQTAVAIENARLFETERSARQRLETLFGIGQAVNSTLDAGAILDRLTDEAMRLTRATHGSALIAQTDLERFDRRSLRGYAPDQIERARSLFLPLDRGLNGRAYRTRQTVYLPDVQADPDYFALIPETRSELVVPILRSGQVLANLDLQSPQADAFQNVDTDLLSALIDQVAIALENARLFEQTRRHLDEMSVVSQVALIGAAGRLFDEAVARAVDGMCQLWPDSSVSFMFVDETGQMLRLHPASRGVSPELVSDFHVPIHQGITGWAVRERQPVRVGDVTLDRRYITELPGVRSEMVAPLTVGESAIGVINVECRWPNSYSGEDLHVLTALASQLATIFEKSRLDAEVAAYTATLEQRIHDRTAEIRQQQARTQAILDALGEGVFVTDLNGNVEYINPAAQTLTGYSAQEALGNNPRLWQSGQTSLAVYQEMWGAILQGQTWRGEIVNRRKDGALYHADLTVTPIPGSDRPNQIMGFAGVQHDISLRKQAEEDMRRALEKEKELGELKSRFISMTSHEFRTPLTTILSSAEMLEHYGARWAEEKKLTHIQRIKSSVQNMTRLLDDVLILGRAEAGRLELNPIPLDLVEFCRDLIEEMQLSAGPKHTLELTCEAACAPAQMDEKLLRQILTNLLSNAIKYSPKGGTVHLSLACQAGRATLQIRDHGIGIPEEALARLFETFHRARNVGAIPGTGLGLAIVKKSVDLHGGTINVYSQVGVGTTVTVVLPQSPQEGG